MKPMMMISPDAPGCHATSRILMVMRRKSA
jgi:hypothetical protein